jgi:hypothetical protein
MNEVKFVKTTRENFNKEPTHDPNNIYFITDQKDLYLGGIKIGSAFAIIDDHTPPPEIGTEGVFYIDKRNGAFSIKVWDDVNKQYVTLPFADTSYVKSISRRDQEIVGTHGDSSESVASLDVTITNSEIDNLFPD